MSIKPPLLKKGDLISIVSPASPPSDSTKIEKAVQYFEKNGFRVTVGKSAYKIYGYLAGKDKERARDINFAFEDKRIKAIICARGGYGSPRILDMIDYQLIRKNPKIFVGYSDITALQLAIFKKTGLITFSGPMAAVEFSNGIDPVAEEFFFEIITTKASTTELKRIGDKWSRPRFKGKSVAQGRLLGGNLSLVTSILGTGYSPDYSGSVLLMEEVAEEPYSIDRMLTQLRLAGIIKKASGFVLGQFTDCQPEEVDKPNFTTEQVIKKELFATGNPVVWNFPYGHVPQKLTLPIGANVIVDPIRRSFTVVENVVD
ncbi:MAG: S66 peptidase family protein [Candidatus Kryptoniota bacterium]